MAAEWIDNIVALRLFRNYITAPPFPAERSFSNFVNDEVRPTLRRASTSTSDTSSTRSRSSSSSSRSSTWEEDTEHELQPWNPRAKKQREYDAVVRKHRELREQKAKETWNQFWG